MNKTKLVFSVLFATGFIFTSSAFASGGEGGSTLVNSVGISIIAATVLAYLAHLLKQPLLLAYLATGMLIGPLIGFGWVSNQADIETISHIGLILLLFLIGLEIDVKKLMDSGTSLITSGISQFLINTLIGLGFFALIGFTISNGNYDLLYLAICCSLSSTAIAVKLLYSKFELDTLAGRLTLGILVFQDIWAILVLGIQPNLANPDVLAIFGSLLKGVLLVLIALVASKYLLPKLFKRIGKNPEMVLVASLGWCFALCGLSVQLGMSAEMGALIAGVSISTFPYNLDVIAKVINIRDFFVTLFFVALGMQIPNPFLQPELLGLALITALFLILSRFISVYPILYGLKNGHRVSLLTSINLAQLSEFSLVIASLGFAAGHISQDILTVIMFTFVITSISSTYLIQFNQQVQGVLAKGLITIGLKDVESHKSEDEDEKDEGKEIALLGFFRVASSLIRETMDDPKSDLKDKILVVDFNPEVHNTLHSLGIKAIYGDISHLDTLHHAGIHEAKLVVSTIPDNILVGTDNLKMIKAIKSLCPHARIVVTAESTARALKMYQEGADYVFLPRILAAEHLKSQLHLLLDQDQKVLNRFRDDQIRLLGARQEIIS
ncbi:MAG: cation:proton antiporter [Bacteroidetes bacterium]|nr:cation:proton antiporter [Bacteroidota bacterium]